MRYKWLNKNNNKALIVFFNGWGMDERIVSHLDCYGYDVLSFFDYRNFNIDEFDFSSYELKTLIAWSMGVYVCNNFYEVYKDFDRLIAVNGTQKPIDDNYGIPKKVYDITVNNFNELSCLKFMKKISSDVDLKNYCARITDELQNELVSLRNLKVSKLLKFDKAIVSTKDKIIPCQNQLNYWNNNGVKVTETDGSHYIFNRYSSWESLL